MSTDKQTTEEAIATVEQLQEQEAGLEKFSQLDSQMEQLAEELYECQDKPIELISHVDADGITSLIIMKNALEEAGFNVSGYHGWPGGSQKNFEELEEDIDDDAVLVFTDLPVLNMATDYMENRRVFIIDHHDPEQPADNNTLNVFYLNPRIYGAPGSGATITYHVSKKITGKIDKDLALAGLMGAYGDYENLEEDVNREILLDAGIEPTRHNILPRKGEFFRRLLSNKEAVTALVSQLIYSNKILTPSSEDIYDKIRDDIKDFLVAEGFKENTRFGTLLKNVEEDKFERKLSEKVDTWRQEIISSLPKGERENYIQTMEDYSEEKYKVETPTGETDLRYLSSLLTKASYIATENFTHFYEKAEEFILNRDKEAIKDLSSKVKSRERYQSAMIIRSIVEEYGPFNLYCNDSAPHFLMLSIRPKRYKIELYDELGNAVKTVSARKRTKALKRAEELVEENDGWTAGDLKEPTESDENERLWDFCDNLLPKVPSAIAGRLANPQAKYHLDVLKRSVKSYLQNVEDGKHKEVTEDEVFRKVSQWINKLKKKISTKQYVLVCFPSQSSSGKNVIRMRMKTPPKLQKEIKEGNEPGIPELIDEVDNRRPSWGIYGGGHPVAGGATIFNTYLKAPNIQWEFESAYTNVKTGKLAEEKIEKIKEELGGARNVPAYYYILRIYAQVEQNASELLKKVRETGNVEEYYPYGAKVPVWISSIMSKEAKAGITPLPVDFNSIDPYHYLHTLEELNMLTTIEIDVGESGKTKTFYRITDKGKQLLSEIEKSRGRVSWESEGAKPDKLL